MTTKQKSAQKSRSHKESQGQRRGARPVKLTDLQKFLISGRKPKRVVAAGELAQLHTEKEAEKKRSDKRKKEAGHEAFQKLAGAQRRS